MHHKDLKEFFKLEQNELLYKQATTPKSCGGGNEFKLLALLGDRVLNLELYEILTKIEGITNSGILTQKINNYIHNEDILYLVGKFLKINEVMIPTDLNHNISKDELKESVEALIGANYKAHGFGPYKELIKEIYKIIKKIEDKIKQDEQLQFYFENPRGKVDELFREHGLPLPIFETRRVGGPDHLPLYKCILKDIFLGKEFNFESGLAKNKPDARRNAAVQFLMMFMGGTKLKQIKKPKEVLIEKKDLKIEEFILDEIVFTKLSSQGQPDQISLSSNTGETLYEWAKRKARKDAFRMIILLASRIQNLSGCSWHASIPNGELIFSYNNLDGKDYYEIGFGESKTKAKKNAGMKFMENSKLLDWLEENYGEKLI